MTTLTSADLITMLRRHHLPEGRPPGGLFAAEIEAPGGRRRADALWMPLTEAGGGLQGFEVKVTRADVLQEIADPTKADAWARYCVKWWLVVADPTLVGGLDVPDHWGVLSPPSGRRTRSMTVLRPAPVINPHDGGPAFRRLLSWYFHRTDAPLAQAQARAEREMERALRAEQELRDRPTAEGQRSPHYQRVDEIIRRAEVSASAEAIWRGIDDDDVVAAIVDTARARAATEEAVRHIERTLAEFQKALQPVTEVVTHLQAVAAGAPPSTRTRRLVGRR